jgi:hypothetical protein
MDKYYIEKSEDGQWVKVWEISKQLNDKMMNIKKEDAIKAYNEGCNDVKKVLKNLFPDIEFEKPPKFKVGDKVWVEAVVDVVDEEGDYRVRYVNYNKEMWTTEYIKESQLMKRN